MDLGQVGEVTANQAFRTLELELRVKIRKQNVDVSAIEGAGNRRELRAVNARRSRELGGKRE